jgi:hypothetical protein
MPSITQGRKRPSEAIVLGRTKENKKVKFTDDGEAVVVKVTQASASPATHSSKVKPDYSKVTRRDDKKDPHSRGDTKEANEGSFSILNAEDVDFPRGGGSTLTPLEHKEMRAEGLRDAEMEIFKVRVDASLILIFDQCIFTTGEKRSRFHSVIEKAFEKWKVKARRISKQQEGKIWRQRRAAD